MLTVKLFSNYYNFFDKVSLLVSYVSFVTKIFNVFISLIENVSVRGEGRRGKMHASWAQVLRVAAIRVPPLVLRLMDGACYFQAKVHLLRWGVGKRYCAGIRYNLFQ